MKLDDTNRARAGRNEEKEDNRSTNGERGRNKRKVRRRRQSQIVNPKQTHVREVSHWYRGGCPLCS